jgi:hypothetical protein
MRLLAFAILLANILLGASPGMAQRRATGMVVDKPSYKATPYKAKLSTRSFLNLPASASLEKYCPTPGDQGAYGTCVAFATAYSMRTIMWAKQNNVTDRSRIDGMTFSPIFVYEQIKNEGDNDCQAGSNPILALELLKQVGVSLETTLPYNCGNSVTFDAMLEALDFTVSDYQTIWDIDLGTPEEKINNTKKALSEGYPVLLGMIVPESFYEPNGSVWRSQPTDGGPSGQHGRHAMCVVGYDDNREGGCFRVMNSWGSDWCDGGYVWVPYSDYGEYAVLALQAYYPRVKEPEPEPTPVEPAPKPVTPEPAPKPEPKPEPKPLPVVQTLLKGSVEFVTNTGAPMPANRVLTRNLIVEDDVPANSEDLVAYRMDNTYPSGTRFRFFVNTNTEAYVYAFATDLSGKVNKILPFDDLMSPHIGPNSTVAFPSDTKVVRMDENRGTDYMLILYSTGPLDANEVLRKMQGESGGLSAKMRAALGNRLLEKGEVKYSTNEIGFEVGSLKTGGVVPLMVELSHN